MQNDQPILQGSSEWLQAKQKTIGGSEIYTLVYHYFRKELEALGINTLIDFPFRTIQELFLKVKFDAKLSQINSVHSEFGNGMEGYVACRLEQELYPIRVERSKDFIVNENFHSLAACSPDGYIRFYDPELNPINQYRKLPDFDKTCEIDHTWGKGMLELKTANYFANFDKGGAKAQYLFQLQYNILVAGCKWGVLAVLAPKDKEYDNDFFKGKIIGQLESWQACYDNTNIDSFAQYYDLIYYIYPILPAFQALITKALNCFQADLDNPDAYPRNEEDLAGLQREKKMLGELWPDKYGTLEVGEGDEIDNLLNERNEAKSAAMFAETEYRKVENELAYRTKKYTEVLGTKQRLIWTSNGQLRFYKRK